MLKQKRVAICFSGQMRNWELASKNILKFFSDENTQVDYFIHTWDTNTEKIPPYVNNKRDFMKVSSKDFDNFLKIYKPVKYHMSKFNQNDWNQSWNQSWDPLFYSFEYSILLKKQYELENNFIYDIVIKARPDVIYNPIHNFSFSTNYNTSSCFTCTPINMFHGEFNMQCFDDVMFFGSSKVMDIMAGLYKYYKVKNKQDIIDDLSNSININRDIFIGPGTLLYQYTVINNIHPDSFYFEYAIVRNIMKNQNLNSINDYNKIYQISRGLYK